MMQNLVIDKVKIRNKESAVGSPRLGNASRKLQVGKLVFVVESWKVRLNMSYG